MNLKITIFIFLAICLKLSAQPATILVRNTEPLKYEKRDGRLKILSYIKLTKGSNKQLNATLNGAELKLISTTRPDSLLVWLPLVGERCELKLYAGKQKLIANQIFLPLIPMDWGYFQKGTIHIMKNMKTDLINYKKKFEQELFGNILPYWMKYGVEKDGHGFYGAVDLDGNPVLSANKTSVLNARILWTFSAAAMIDGNLEYAEIADKAYNVITEDFEDKELGGYYMELSSDNKVANDIKHTYAQAFVIYALCKYYEFRPLDAVMQKIQSLFALLEYKTKDTENVGYRESFTRDWKIYGENRMADNNEPKSMNTHLHVLEAWAALYKIWKDPKVELRLTELMNLFLERIIRENGHFGIFFNEAFEEAESSKGICSFGHDIEGSWLLWEAAEILGNKEILDKMRFME